MCPRFAFASGEVVVRGKSTSKKSNKRVVPSMLFKKLASIASAVDNDADDDEEEADDW